MENFAQIIFSNFFAFDGLIFILAIVNVVVFIMTLRSANRLYNTMNLSVYVPGHEISEIVNEKEITHLKEPKIIALRQKTTRRYTLYINITAIFPLMGILGTVLSLITIAQDMTNIQANFFAALTSTFWGLIFAIIYKMLDGVLASKIEDNEKNVELYLERNTVKTTGEKQKVTK